MPASERNAAVSEHPLLMEYHARPATPLDARSIGRIQVASWQAAYRGIIPAAYLDSLDASKRSARWKEHITTKSCGVSVVVSRDAIVGWSSFGPAHPPHEKTDGEIYGFYLDPSVWGTTAAATLMANTLEVLGPSWKTLRLEVLRDNLRARRFYEKFRWRPEGTTGSWSTPEGVSVPTMSYSRPVFCPPVAP